MIGAWSGRHPGAGDPRLGEAGLNARGGEMPPDRAICLGLDGSVSSSPRSADRMSMCNWRRPGCPRARRRFQQAIIAHHRHSRVVPQSQPADDDIGRQFGQRPLIGERPGAQQDERLIHPHPAVRKSSRSPDAPAGCIAASPRPAASPLPAGSPACSSSSSRRARSANASESASNAGGSWPDPRPARRPRPAPARVDGHGCRSQPSSPVQRGVARSGALTACRCRSTWP